MSDLNPAQRKILVDGLKRLTVILEAGASIEQAKPLIRDVVTRLMAGLNVTPLVKNMLAKFLQ